MAVTGTARQFVVSHPGHGKIVRVDLPPRQEDAVLVRARYSGISRGTETLVFRGAVPPSQYEAMRAPFQQGDYPGPVTSGYSSVGVVEEGPETLAGRTVFSLYPHQDRYLVPAAAVHPVPDDVPAERAVLAANMETAVNIAWDAAPVVGSRIVVIGGGVVGLLAAARCRDVAATSVTVVDPNRSRESVADALGLQWRPDPPPAATADLVIHASGAPGGLRAALDVAATEGTIVEASWYGAREVTLPLGEAFHVRRLTIRSSQVGRVPPRRAAEWTRERRLRFALSLLADGRFDALITHESPFEEVPRVMARLSAAPDDTLCHRIRYGNGA
ncbi:MAG: zinc-binding alcohol dehydrogenase [Acidobacteria bacterium]|nr:zinc-binding alcohol dehydrogenase [Acidobacteriota bacterium]